MKALEITRNDPMSALRRYGEVLEIQSAICGSSPAMNRLRELRAAEMASIWAKELSPAFRGGWDSSILAANNVDANLQTLSGTLVVQKSLELLRFNYPILAAVTSDFSSERLALDQEMTTRMIAVPAVKTYSTSTGWEDASLTSTDVVVTVDKHVGVPLTFNAQQIQGTIRNLFDELAPAASAALARDMVTSLYALITAGNFTQPAVVCALPEFGRGTVVDVATALTKRGVPLGPDDRTLLLSADFFGALSKDVAIVTLATHGRAEPGEGSSLSAVADFRVCNTPTLPTTGNLCGFAFSRSALVIATRLAGDYMKALPAAAYGNRYVVSDPQLGIAVQVIDFVNHTLGTATRRLSLMYGVARGQPDAGQILVSK